MAFIRKNNIKEAIEANSSNILIADYSTDEGILASKVRDIRTQIDEVLNENVFRINNEVTRQIVKHKITEILHAAKEQSRNEGRCFDVGGKLVPASALNPTVEVVCNPVDYNSLDCQFNLDAALLVNEMYDTSCKIYDTGAVIYTDNNNNYVQGTTTIENNVKYKI